MKLSFYDDSCIGVHRRWTVNVFKFNFILSVEGKSFRKVFVYGKENFKKLCVVKKVNFHELLLCRREGNNVVKGTAYENFLRIAVHLLWFVPAKDPRVQRPYTTIYRQLQ